MQTGDKSTVCFSDSMTPGKVTIQVKAGFSLTSHNMDVDSQFSILFSTPSQSVKLTILLLLVYYDQYGAQWPSIRKPLGKLWSRSHHCMTRQKTLHGDCCNVLYNYKSNHTKKVLVKDKFISLNVCILQ